MTHPESQAELLPCPFCGSEPFIFDMAGWEIFCKNPQCDIRMALDGPERAPLVAAWNRRAALPPVAAVPDVQSHPYERDLAGLYAFIDGMCQKNSQLIAIAEAAWYKCMARNHLANQANLSTAVEVMASPKIPFAVTWYCELADCLCHGHAASVRAKCINFIGSTLQPAEQATSDADKLRRLREGLDKWGWCAEFGALAREVLSDAPQQPEA